MYTKKSVLLGLFVAVCFTFIGGNKVFAAAYNVTTTSACDLADAITASDTQAVAGSCAAGTSSNTISLAAGTYNLSAGLPTIDNNPLTITGAGSEKTIINGDNQYKVFGTTTSTVNISNLTIIGAGENISGYYAILLNVSGSSVSNVVIRDSTAASGIAINEPATINDVAINNVISPNGGGIFFDGFGSGAVNVTNTTISNVDGGGIWEDERAGGTINLINDTIANNTAAGSAAGIIIWGLNNGPGTVMNLENTILANNIETPSTSANCGDTGTMGGFPLYLPTSLGHNISDDSSCSAAFTLTGDLNSTDPLLGSLTLDNDTYVLPITSSSPAYGAADPSVSPALDQVGTARPQCSSYDIGAYEVPCVVTSSTGGSHKPGAPSTGYGIRTINTLITAEILIGLASVLVLAGVVIKKSSR